jgi:phage replication initiation protein
MSTSDSYDRQHDAGAELVPAGSACLHQHGDQAGTDPRVVTTGRKVHPDQDGGQPVANIDADTGEPVSIFASGRRGIKVVRHLVPDDQARTSVALIDALAFTVVPPEGCAPQWLQRQMEHFLEVASVKEGRGCFGFKHSARFGDGVGLIAWGGKSQRGRVYFSIQGQGCSMVKDWPALAAWLELNCATIKRVDVAYDDFDGETISIAWATAQYERGGFNAGGRRPKHQVFGDWLDGGSGSNGRTFGVGSRACGKYCRIYEKGKQQGDPKSRWTRIEVEWRAQDRLLPYDVLTRPGQYLAGAYPCLRSLSVEQSRIKTLAKASTITFERAMDNARQQTGKLVHLMMRVFGGDYAAVVDHLKREGTPARIDPFSYHLRGAPERLDPDAPGSFAKLLSGD